MIYNITPKFEKLQTAPPMCPPGFQLIFVFVMPQLVRNIGKHSAKRKLEFVPQKWAPEVEPKITLRWYRFWLYFFLLAALKMRFSRNGGTETNSPKGHKVVLKTTLRHIFEGVGICEYMATASKWTPFCLKISKKNTENNFFLRKVWYKIDPTIFTKQFLSNAIFHIYTVYIYSIYMYITRSSSPSIHRRQCISGSFDEGAGILFPMLLLPCSFSISQRFWFLSEWLCHKSARWLWMASPMALPHSCGKTLWELPILGRRLTHLDLLGIQQLDLLVRMREWPPPLTYKAKIWTYSIIRTKYDPKCFKTRQTRQFWGHVFVHIFALLVLSRKNQDA